MSTPRLAAPPGRAGRLWFQRRLAVARRGVDVLDRKLHILSAELTRLRAEAARTQRDFDAACLDAREWLLRASLLGGERAVRLAAAQEAAQVRVTYTVTMGARHPAAASCTTASAPTWDGAAVAGARSAHARALQAGVAHAAASASLRIIEAEAAATRYRLRAVRDRWIPRLEQALAQTESGLEELERADGARLRQVMRARGTGPLR